jgi:hypothetical protein
MLNVRICYHWASLAIGEAPAATAGPALADAIFAATGFLKTLYAVH